MATTEQKHKLFIIDRRKDGIYAKVGSTIISVKTAKKPGAEWNQDLRDDIETSRASYHVMWGGVPAWDYYDRLDSTYNYIAYVQYPGSDGETAREVLSNRFVLKDPEDVKFYAYGSVPLDKILPNLIREGIGCYPKLAGESRIGTIRPTHRTSNEHTMEAFAAIKLAMIQDARRESVDYIACQLREEMPKTVFTVGDISYDFPRTEDFLGLERGTIRLNRRSKEVISHIINYPGYFLNTEDVHRIMNEVIESGGLSLEEFKGYTGLSSVKDLLKPRNVKQLVPIITEETSIGAYVKSRLLNDARDGTYSSIAHIDYIEKMVIELLKKMAGLESPKV